MKEMEAKTENRYEYRKPQEKRNQIGNEPSYLTLMMMPQSRGKEVGKC